MIKTFALTLTAALLLAAMLGGCAGAADAAPEFVLRYAENQAQDYPTTMGAYRFAELVKERTNGRIEIHVYYGAKLGDEKSVIEQLQFGSIDLARVALPTLAEFSPSLNALQLPYLYRDESHMWLVLDGEIGKEFLDSVESIGMTGLSWYGAGARCFYNSRREIRTPADLTGMRVRVQESSLMMSMVSALGAQPVPMVFSEVYSALEKGEVDAAENNTPSYESTSHYKVAPYFVLNEHTRVPEMQLMSKITMEKLSAQDIAIIRECAMESARFEREEWTRREKESEDRVRAAGAVITVLSDDEKQLFRDACIPLYEQFAGEYMDTVNKIINTR